MTSTAGSRTRDRWVNVRRLSRRAIIVALVGIAAGFAVAIVAGLVPQPARDLLNGICSVAVLSCIVALLLGVLVNTSARVALWWMRGPVRWGIFAPRVRRVHLLAQYDGMVMQLRDGLALVRVVRVYQVARRGSKALVEHPFGFYQDAWFWATRPRTGDVYLVRASNAFGPHNDLLSVMYVGSNVTGHGVIYRLPRAAWRAARRRARGGRPGRS